MKKWMVQHQAAGGNQGGTKDTIVEILLKNRGITGKQEIDRFLHPVLEEVTIESVGLDKKELEKATNRIKKALKEKESIIVYTDYDVDGVTSGALVWETLHLLGGTVMPYVPHRVSEGYGLSIPGIDTVKREHDADLIVTVDHGITAFEKIEYAKKLGIDVIVVDHHLLPQKEPDTVATVHTTQLTAAGIAWLFSDYLIQTLSSFSIEKKNFLKEKNLELAVLGTVADLIPLLGNNRIIAKFGIEQLRKTKRIGLDTLIEESNIQKKEIDTYTISHMLAPRINAVGRITHAIDALRLLCTKDRDRALKLAQNLGRTNLLRQSMTQDSLALAMDMVQEEIESNKGLPKILMVKSKDFQQGIIGLIAGKLTEIFTRPSIALSMGDGVAKASARSIPGFNIVNAFQKVSDLLVDLGGHPMAAGFTVKTEHIEELKKRLLQIAQNEISEDMLKKTVRIDTPLEFDQITTEFYTRIKSLAPFGVGNWEPVFMTENVTVVGARKVGKEGKHIKLSLQKGKQVEAIGFGLGEVFEKLQKDLPIDVAYTINENIWNGVISLQLKLKDVRLRG